MYTFSSKLKLFSIIAMVLGALLFGYGYFTTPHSVDEVKEMLAEEAAHGGHGSESAHATDAHSGAAVSAHGTEEAHGVHSGDEHAEHVLHQLQNRPWSALYIAAFFFFMISLGVLAFYGIQRAAQAGWSPVLYRVMEGITGYLPVGALVMFVLLVLASFHVGHNHIFHWMSPELLDPNSPDYDPLTVGKSPYLNVTGLLVRAAIYIAGWALYRHFSRKFSIAQDSANDISYHKKNFRISAAFLVFFLVSESMMSWDWIMAVDHHWFSTLFGWYVFAGMMVCGVSTIAMISIYLKGKGYLDFVNDSHIHDLAKFMFGFSIFWTYLWFSQFMLIWYSNIPEEVTYFVTRIEDYKLPFFGMVAMNFIFPLLILMNSDYKRLNFIVITAGIVILLGHYVDVFNMIMPATVGDRWFIGAAEVGSMLFFFGLFIFVVFTTLTKAPLLAKGDPFVEESKHFHY
ncbi:quinol:cytochrome C oxidoreductase [Sungkyunkwania multivorans]|uniref:Quinol:cytochrome C oxidoreductase n=1 Tax=Sungkyunkwania multivorans TaxID=1173618 RepID=A0ABW3CTB2_9FLAO